MKTKKIKALKMWGGRNNLYSTYYAGEGVYGKITRTKYVIPADAASVEAMVEQMAQSMSSSAVPWDHIGHGAQQVRINMIRAALAAIGIPSRAPKSALPNV